MNEEQAELFELHQLAKKELNQNEVLTIWAGGDAVNQQDELARAFNQKFPDIKIDIKVDLSKIHDVKINKELMDGSLTPDVVMLQTSNDFEDWKKQGVLEAYKPKGFSQIRKEFIDEDEGTFSAFRMFAFLPQVSKDGVLKKPENITDFLAEEFKNKIIATYPHDDDAVLFVYSKMLQQEGETFLKEFANLNPIFIRGTAVPPLLVGNGRFLGTITGYETTAEMPSDSFIPKNDFFISWAQRIAMFKLTKHKNTAKLFIAFVQSEEFQKSLGKYSVRKDTKDWIGRFDNTDPVGFYEFMRDRQSIHELRKLMEEYFGKVKGASPVEDHKMIKATYGWNNIYY